MKDQNYIQKRLDVVLNRGKDVWVWDVEGNHCRKGRNRIYFMTFLKRALV